MAYSIVNNNRDISIGYSGVSSYHIGTLYGGLKDSKGSVTGNLKYTNLDGAVVNPAGWCTIALSKVDDTAVKILATCIENTSETADRSCTLKLQYGTKQSATLITIKQAHKTAPVETFTFETLILLDVLLQDDDHPNVRFSIAYVKADYESDNGLTYEKDEIISMEYFNNNPGTNIWFGTYTGGGHQGVDNGMYTGCPNDIICKGQVKGINQVKIINLYIDGVRVHMHENDSGSMDQLYWMLKMSNMSWSSIGYGGNTNIHYIKGPAGTTLTKGSKLGDMALCDI